MSEIDRVIEQYKRELLGEAELARGDVQEIEDHLRTLTAELCERGMPPADAVRTACESLGDPRAVAREHAKVSSCFGARLSWARTISAASLLLSQVLSNYIVMWINWHKIPDPFAPLAATALGTLMVAALLARLTWARPIVLGATGFMTLFTIEAGMGAVDPDASMLWLVALVGTVVFVMPWRRNELYRAGYALTLEAFAFSAMAIAAGGYIDTVALVGFFPLVIAIAGTILRARWAAFASAFGAAILLVSVTEVIRYYAGFHELALLGEWLPFASLLLAGAIAASVAAVTSWRAARSNTGTLQYVLR